MTLYPYKSNYAIHPGKTVREALDSQGMNQNELAIRIDVSTKHLNQIILGESPITSDTAIKLEFALGVPALFLLSLQKNYEVALTRVRKEKELEREIEFSKNFPYAEMSKWGWVPEAKKTVERIDNLLRFFGVSSLQSIKTLNCTVFRKSFHFKASDGALAAWLRKGEVEARAIETGSYDRDKIIDLIPILRGLTRKDLRIAGDELQRLCAGCGIAVIPVRQPSKSHANGAAKWLRKDKAMILLSLRHAYADIFWFSFFHELGHLLRHSKKSTFVDGVGKSAVSKDVELEADTFAAHALIPSEDFVDFVDSGDFSSASIRKFSRAVGVGDGIVVGRLQHDRLIAHNMLNGLRNKYHWKA